MVIWFGLVVVVASWLGFFRGDVTWHNLYQEVSIEGHHTAYDLCGISLVLVIFLDIQFSLSLDMKLVGDYEH